MKLVVATGLCFVLIASAHGQEEKNLGESLRFLASFDSSINADRAPGDGRLMTAKNLQREEVEAGLATDAVEWKREGGKFGGYLSFNKKTDAVVFFSGANNLPSTQREFAGTFSFWLRLDPNEDLPPGYVDPLQITDKKWNDSSFFVDFTDMNPRQFRMGVFSDYSFWNPEDRKWEEISEKERPMVSVDKTPFQRDAWTHVAITFAGLNREDEPGTATLFLNGKAQGTLQRPLTIHWEPRQVAILLGIYYIGDLDEFAVFDRPLSQEQVEAIAQSKESLVQLIQ